MFTQPAVREHLENFVLLRIDVDKSTIGRAQHIHVLPSYFVYDPGERARFFLIGATPANNFTDWVDAIRDVQSKLIRASDLFEEKKDLEAELLVGNAYSHLGLADPARAAYKHARQIAEARGEKGPAQLAEALSAFLFVREGNPRRAIKMLHKLAENPADRETEALIWLTMGNAYRFAKEMKSAADAYQRAQSLAVPDSTTYKEASAAIARLQ